MEYFWKVVLNNGREYVVVNKESDPTAFAETIFSKNANVTISFHELKGGGDVVIVSTSVASIEYNIEM